jgi:biotin operon repressor
VLEVLQQGKGGRILLYTRPNGRCPAREFLHCVPQHLMLRFQREFDRFCQVGMQMVSVATFKPLYQEGKGIWSWKTFDQRLYAFRGPDIEKRAQMILLCGWVKDKGAHLGGCIEERTQVTRAQAMRKECEARPEWKEEVNKMPERIGEGTAGRPAEAARGIVRPAEEAPLRDDIMAAPVVTEPSPVTEVLGTQLALAPVPAVVEPPKESPKTTISDTDMAILVGVPVEWLAEAIGRGLIPGAMHQDDGSWAFNWSEAVENEAQIKKLREDTMVKFVCKECGRKFDTDRGLRGHMSSHSDASRGLHDGDVSREELARRIGISIGALQQWINRKHIFGGTKEAGKLRRVWTEKQADAIVRRVRGYQKRMAQLWLGRERTRPADGMWHCPTGCGANYVQPGPLMAHMKSCALIWDPPKVALPSTEQPSAPPPPVVRKVQKARNEVRNEDILAAIEINHTLSTEDISTVTGLSRTGAQKRMWKLRDAGVVNMSGGGRGHKVLWSLKPQPKPQPKPKPQVKPSVGERIAVAKRVVGQWERGEDGIGTLTTKPRVKPPLAKRISERLVDPETAAAQELVQMVAVMPKTATRAELMQMAESVIGGKASPDFVRLVKAHRAEIDRLREEMARLSQS